MNTPMRDFKDPVPAQYAQGQGGQAILYRSPISRESAANSPVIATNNGYSYDDVYSGQAQRTVRGGAAQIVGNPNDMAAGRIVRGTPQGAVDNPNHPNFVSNHFTREYGVVATASKEQTTTTTTVNINRDYQIDVDQNTGRMKRSKDAGQDDYEGVIMSLTPRSAARREKLEQVRLERMEFAAKRQEVAMEQGGESPGGIRRMGELEEVGSRGQVFKMTEEVLTTGEKISGKVGTGTLRQIRDDMEGMQDLLREDDRVYLGKTGINQANLDQMTHAERAAEEMRQSAGGNTSIEIEEAAILLDRARTQIVNHEHLEALNASEVKTSYMEDDRQMRPSEACTGIREAPSHYDPNWDYQHGGYNVNSHSNYSKGKGSGKGIGNASMNSHRMVE